MPCISYSSYKNDIISFNHEEYLKSTKDSVSLNLFYNFIENYREIENEDFKKPIFSQTSKFKKIPNNYKNYKYIKISRDNDDVKKNWVFDNPDDETDKISVLIKTYLNKISQDTYKKISVDFINELILINNSNLFEIISRELINKCLFDNKFRNLYINLCYKIWSNKQIHYNLVNIISDNNLYRWEMINSEYVESKNLFTNEINAKNDVYIQLNFKKYFINYIEKLYKNKDLNFDNLNEDEIFLKKKKIILLVELIGILYLEKYINFDIINLIIIDLLHINNNFKQIEDIEYETLYTLIKLIKDNKKTYNDLLEYKIIFNEFIDIIKNILLNTSLSKRYHFFMTDIIIMIESFINENKIDKQNKDDNKILEIIKNNSNNSLEDILNIYKTIVKKENIINNCIELFISEKKRNNLIIIFLKKINENKLIYTIIDKIISNISDIILDIPDADQKIIYLVNNIYTDNEKKKSVLNILKNIEKNDYSSNEDSGEEESGEEESGEESGEESV